MALFPAIKFKIWFHRLLPPRISLADCRAIAEDLVCPYFFPLFSLLALGFDRGLVDISLRLNARTEVRRNRYKVAVGAEEGRRRREDNMIEIRKNRREENLQKKRREGMQAKRFPTSGHQSVVEKKLETLPAMVAYVWSEDPSLRL